MIQVAIQPFFGDHGQDGDPESQPADGLGADAAGQLLSRLPHDAAANGDQRDAQQQGGGGFDAGVAVRMLAIGGLGALMAGPQHEEIGEQVGERMQAMRNQRLRMRQPADQHLHAGQ